METEFKKVAINTALKAGKLLKELFGKERQISFKGEVDLVTEADLRSQELILKELSQKFPDHSFLMEEGERKEGNSTYLWLIDPLDGTTNYAHQYPVFAVSIALAIEGKIVLGVVCDPNRHELFVAEKNKGAYLNNKPIRVSHIKDLNRALLATGFPYWRRERPERLFANFKAFSMRAQGVRRAGSAALDLCALACGRIDGFWEEGLKPWDTAAGSLIVEEAGGILTKFDGSKFDIYVPEVVASNKLIHQQMLETLQTNKRIF